MVLKIIAPKASEKSIIFFLIISLFLVIQNISAQNETDTTKKTLLASLESKSASGFFIRKSNVVFPEILKGNEAEMLPYIEKFSSRKRDYLMKMYAKGKTILPKVATILKKYNLPEELKVLLTLESEYNGNAVSRGGAVGYWQIMDEVAKDYGMKYIGQDAAQKKNHLKLKDDRKNFNLATHTASRYLSDTKRKLDENWLLVVASYNCGAGNLRKAIKKSGKANPTFWDIKKYLPAETRAYVMNFITLSVIFKNYELFANNKLSFADQKIMLPDNLEKSITETTTE